MNDFIPEPHAAVGLILGVFGVLVMIAFRAHAITRKGTAVAHLGAALFWLSALTVGRMIWWDVFQGFGLGIQTNLFWNTLGLIALLHALRGFHALLPDEDRKNFNIITAVFYPRRLWWKLRAGSHVE